MSSAAAIRSFCELISWPMAFTPCALNDILSMTVVCGTSAITIVIKMTATNNVALQQRQHISVSRKWLIIIIVNVFSSSIVCSVTLEIVIVLSPIGQLCLMTNLSTMRCYAPVCRQWNTYIHICNVVCVCVCVLRRMCECLTAFGVIDSRDYGQTLVEFRCKAFNCMPINVHMHINRYIYTNYLA